MYISILILKILISYICNNFVIFSSSLEITVKPVISSHSIIDKTKIFMTNDSLMGVESIALSDNWSLKPIFGVVFEWPLKTSFNVLIVLFKI